MKFQYILIECFYESLHKLLTKKDLELSKSLFVDRLTVQLPSNFIFFIKSLSVLAFTPSFLFPYYISLYSRGIERVVQIYSQSISLSPIFIFYSFLRRSRIPFYMEEKIKRCFSLLIAEKITINGVESIVTIADKTVEVKLFDKRLFLTGNGFTPLHLDLDKGILMLSGDVTNVKIGGAQENFFKKVFK